MRNRLMVVQSCTKVCNKRFSAAGNTSCVVGNAMQVLLSGFSLTSGPVSQRHAWLWCSAELCYTVDLTCVRLLCETVRPGREGDTTDAGTVLYRYDCNDSVGGQRYDHCSSRSMPPGNNCSIDLNTRSAHCTLSEIGRLPSIIEEFTLPLPPLFILQRCVRRSAFGIVAPPGTTDAWAGSLMFGGRTHTQTDTSVGLPCRAPCMRLSSLGREADTYKHWHVETPIQFH